MRRNKQKIITTLKPAPKNLKPCKRQLEMGIKVEMEHTKSRVVAKRIAMHHLAEDSKYYSKLKKMESK